MVVKWWDLAADYAEASKALASGHARGVRNSIAEEYGVSDVTVARAMSARSFVRRLVQQGRLQSMDLLRGIPVTFLSALARIDRFRPELVDEKLPALLAGSLTGDQLRNLEAEVLSGQATGAVRGETKRIGAVELRDGYALRIRAKAFRDHAFAALSAPGGALPSESLKKTDGRLFDFPLSVDALSEIPAADHGLLRAFRFYAAGSMDRDRKRLAWALLSGSLASRIFEQYVAVFEREKDAWELASTLAGIGRLGFGVAFVDDTGQLRVALDPARDARPDLQGRYLGLLTNVLREEAE